MNATRERRKAERVMETGTDGISSQEEDRARIKHIREQGRITVTVRGIVYVLMKGTSESELFAAYAEQDAYSINLVVSCSL